MAEKKEKKRSAKNAEAHAKKPVAASAEKKEKTAARKTKAVLKAQRLLKRKHLPTFRGRFGVKSIRRKGIEKWQKWRHPIGRDVHRTQEDGAWPKPGYRSRKEIRFLHPSGYKEVLVRNPQEILGLKDCIVKIAATVGKKKRKQMIAEANKIGLRIAN